MREWVSDRVRERFPEAVVEIHRQHGDDTVVVHREWLLRVLQFLRDEPGLMFRMPLDVTCVDRLAMGPQASEQVRALNPPLTDPDPVPRGPGLKPRFEVVYHLRSLIRTEGPVIRVKVRVDEDDPVVPSAVGLFKGFNWFEREVYDMFGVRFEGHPDLRRILLYPEFHGHPLRKDYPRRGHQPLVPMPRLQADPVPRGPGERG